MHGSIQFMKRMNYSHTSKNARILSRKLLIETYQRLWLDDGVLYFFYEYTIFLQQANIHSQYTLATKQGRVL